VKQKDLALIGAVVLVSIIFSVLISKAIFSTKSKQQQGAVVQPISSAFQTPSTSTFNNSMFDPSSLITIGQSNNSNPFNGSSTSP
jgi:hypothetical protein